MEKLTGLCVLLAALSLAVTEDTYFTDGGTLTLDVKPRYPDPITNILWRFNGNLLAEWIKDKVPVEFYRSFKARSTLDTTNGQLGVSRMATADTGVYSVEINSNVQSVSYTAKLISIVRNPVVRIRTLTCAASSEMCTVSCDGVTTDAEPVTYSWKMGSKEWEVLGKNIEITAIKNGHDKNITCWMTNPVSEEVSETINNPLYWEDKTEPPSSLGPVLGGLFGVVIVVLIVVGVAMWKFKKCPFHNQDPPIPAPADKSATKEEETPFNGNQPA